MTPKEIYGLSRSRDKKGNVVSRNLNPFVNCLHTLVGHCRENMEVYVIEVYGQEINEDDNEDPKAHHAGGEGGGYNISDSHL